LVALYSPIQGFLGHECVVEDTPTFHEARLVGPDNVWEECLNPSSEHFGQDFVRAAQKRDWSPIAKSGVVSELGDESYQAFVDVG
jgi:hypothetical protein